MKVITFSGLAEAGKDSSAKILKELLEADNKKVIIVHFADYLKFICREYLGWDGKKGVEGRTLLQEVGTEEVRSVRHDFWAETLAVIVASTLTKRFDYVLIPDTRFPNEADIFKMWGLDLMAINVVRLGHNNALTEAQKTHKSETAMSDYKFDYTIESENGLDKLAREVTHLFMKLRKEWVVSNDSHGV
jgi:hypothetical protein